MIKYDAFLTFPLKISIEKSILLFINKIGSKLATVKGSKKKKGWEEEGSPPPMKKIGDQEVITNSPTSAKLPDDKE